MTNDSRIIGDFLEINADIIEHGANSKLPKFLINMRKKKYKNRLHKSILKLANSNLVLNKDNLAEYFVYLYNNYSPNGAFRSTFKVSVLGEDFERMEAVIKFEDIMAIIKINQEDQEGFEITARTNGLGNENSFGFSIRATKLSSGKPDVRPLIEQINKQLLQDMSEFLMDLIFRPN